MIYIAKRISLEINMQVSKWGNSLAVRLPKALVDSMELTEGDELDVFVADKKTIAISKAANREAVLKELSKFRLELPAGYTFDREDANKR
jgi:antitoxin MazE